MRYAPRCRLPRRCRSELVLAIVCDVTPIASPGPHSKWIVGHRDNHVVLQNQKQPRLYLSIRSGTLSKDALGKHAEFKVHRSSADPCTCVCTLACMHHVVSPSYALLSCIDLTPAAIVTLSGAHELGTVGIRADGTPAPPSLASTGLETQFRLIHC